MMSKTTPRILYGQISAKQLADLFQKHGKNIFAKNIRNYVGSSDVNDAIAKTLREEPDLLMHLNNGLTMVCREFKPRAAALQAQGFIDVRGLSIVNGAQTVGSIAKVANELDLSTSPARVLVTLIESASANPDFEMRVTRARNTQNRVRVADFAAQDGTQERLRRELAVSGIAYVYKPSNEVTLSGASTIKLEDAALALAALSSNLEDVFLIRSYPGQLSDPENEAYKRLFTEFLTGMNLYRKVIVFQFLNSIADETERASPNNSREKAFYKNLRFLVMHFIKRRHASLLEGPDWQLSEADKQTLSRAFNELSVKILDIAIASGYSRESTEGFLAISRKLTSFKQLASRIQTALNSTTTKSEV
jgi:AIPR protein